MSTSNEFTPEGRIVPQSGSTVAGTPPASAPVEPGLADPAAGSKPMTAQAREEARRVADRLEEGVRERGEQLRDRVEAKADAGRSRAAETSDALAAAFRAAGDTLRDRHEDRLGHLTDELAEQVQHFAGYLRDNDMRGLMDNIEDVARRNPTGFLGSSLAAGLMAGRFLRASGHEARDDSGRMGEPKPTEWRPPSHREFGASPATDGPSAPAPTDTGSLSGDRSTGSAGFDEPPSREWTEPGSSRDSTFNRGGFQ